MLVLTVDQWLRLTAPGRGASSPPPLKNGRRQIASRQVVKICARVALSTVTFLPSVVDNFRESAPKNPRNPQTHSIISLSGHVPASSASQSRTNAKFFRNQFSHLQRKAAEVLPGAMLLFGQEGIARAQIKAPGGGLMDDRSSETDLTFDDNNRHEAREEWEITSVLRQFEEEHYEEASFKLIDFVRLTEDRRGLPEGRLTHVTVHWTRE